MKKIRSIIRSLGVVLIAVSIVFLFFAETGEEKSRDSQNLSEVYHFPVVFNANYTLPENGRVVIFDALSMYFPYYNFSEEVSSLLEEKGYSVDLYSGENVTLEAVEKLPHPYEVMIFRTHSGEGPDGSETLFSGQIYSEFEYPLEQISGEVHPAQPDYAPNKVLAFNNKFVKSRMKGRFNHTLVIVMGCEGSSTGRLARAFIDNGAEAYIAWDGPVSLEDTDRAFTYLIREMLKKKGLDEVVQDINKRFEFQSSEYTPSLEAYTEAGRLAEPDSVHETLKKIAERRQPQQISIQEQYRLNPYLTIGLAMLTIGAVMLYYSIKVGTRS